MKPKELYKRTPEKIDKDINVLHGCYYNFIPEVQGFDFCQDIPDGANELVEIHYYKDFDFDGRRFWRLAAVKYNGEFVMIIQNAGREGDDWTERFITNFEFYVGMVGYIQTLVPTSRIDTNGDYVSPNTDIKGLDDFYGNNLDGYFERY